MNTISFQLEQEGYYSIGFRIRKSNHLYINGKLNKTKALFLIDTGASNTCVDSNAQDDFKILSKNLKSKASGAGTNNMDAASSKNNQLQLGIFKINDVNLIVLDLSHVNIALEAHGLPTVHGIIGSDLLKKHGAIISYPEQLLFIK